MLTEEAYFSVQETLASPVLPASFGSGFPPQSQPKNQNLQNTYSLARVIPLELLAERKGPTLFSPTGYHE